MDRDRKRDKLRDDTDRQRVERQRGEGKERQTKREGQRQIDRGD